jgi:hypothetical protein
VLEVLCDEVSMVPPSMLAEIDKCLRVARWTSLGQQLKPIANKSLASAMPSPGRKLWLRLRRLPSCAPTCAPPAAGSTARLSVGKCYVMSISVVPLPDNTPCSADTGTCSARVCSSQALAQPLRSSAAGKRGLSDVTLAYHLLAFARPVRLKNFSC